MRRVIPDILSLIRIPCAAAIVIFYSDEEMWRFVTAVCIILLALVTDFLDGTLARRFRVTSRNGYIIDGLGDRAVYIALFLAFLVQQEIGLLASWLLIFREVAIYAARLFSDSWFEANKTVRYLSRLHAGLLRIWILLMIVGDGIWIFAGLDPLSIFGWSSVQAILLFATIAFSYYALLQHVRAILAVA